MAERTDLAAKLIQSPSVNNTQQRKLYTLFHLVPKLPFAEARQPTQKSLYKIDGHSLDRFNHQNTWKLDFDESGHENMLFSLQLRLEVWRGGFTLQFHCTIYLNYSTFSNLTMKCWEFWIYNLNWFTIINSSKIMEFIFSFILSGCELLHLSFQVKLLFIKFPRVFLFVIVLIFVKNCPQYC